MKTAFLMALMTALLMLLGDFFGGLRGVTVMLFVGVAMNFFAYWNSDKMVLAHYDAQQVDRNSAPELYGIVEKLAKKPIFLCRRFILSIVRCLTLLLPAEIRSMLPLR